MASFHQPSNEDGGAQCNSHALAKTRRELAQCGSPKLFVCRKGSLGSVQGTGESAVPPVICRQCEITGQFMAGGEPNRTLWADSFRDSGDLNISSPTTQRRELGEDPLL